MIKYILVFTCGDDMKMGICSHQYEERHKEYLMMQLNEWNFTEEMKEQLFDLQVVFDEEDGSYYKLIEVDDV